MTETNIGFEQQLEKVLASPVFQTSRQLRHFLEFTAGRVLSGAPSVDQFEIATEVLGKPDFDPTMDASVRKLATQVRQRLEKYYESHGARDTVLITLPLRSYAPVFETRNPDAVQSTLQSIPTRAPRRVSFAVILVTALIPIALATLWIWGSAPASRPVSSTEAEIRTAFGDIKAPAPDAAPGTLQLSSVSGTYDELTTRLSFIPNHEGQYAGVVFWEGPQRYVALGRRFTSGNFIALTAESATAQTLESPDREGQSGTPIWLKLRREADTFTAFTSADGVNWTMLGKPIEVVLGATTRSGLYAFNGRRDSPSIPAVFHLPAQSSYFARNLAPADAWTLVSNCGDRQDLTNGEPAAGDPCEATLTRPVPRDRGWSVTTRVETDDTSALSAGLFVRSESGKRIRIVRYRTDASTIAFIQDGRLLENAPDFPGRPPVYLRLKQSNVTGEIEGYYSVNGADFLPVGKPVDLASFGRLRSVGLVAARREPVPQNKPVRVSFQAFWQDLFPLEIVRFPSRR